MSAATHAYSATAPIGHLSLGEWIENEEAEAVRHHVHTMRLYREIIAMTKANLALLDAEVLDRCLPGWDRDSIVGTLDDLMTPRVTEGEIEEMALEAYWQGQGELGA